MEQFGFVSKPAGMVRGVAPHPALNLIAKVYLKEMTEIDKC
jgi:hypothetical protein